jgi:membrane-associated protease RseP (regulator of RpoE activity)
MPPLDRHETGSFNGYHPSPQVFPPLIVRPEPQRLFLHLFLFLLTFATTALAGALQKGVYPVTSFSALVFGVLAHPEALVHGLPFAVPLMLILLCHEMGHYLFARKHGVRASLPYFLPAPPFPLLPIGTFGAFIRMRSVPTDRRTLFDIGAAGPWGGMIVAVPAVIIGLALSEVRPLSPFDGGLYLGDSFLFSLLTRLVLGVSGNDVNIELHPIALAGWFGLFVTFLNLLPVGQLDGGHVTYALFGRFHRWISRGFLAVIFFLGFQGWVGWFFWVALLSLLGIDHPPTHDMFSTLDPRRKLYAWGTVGLFGLTFMSAPLMIVEPKSLPEEEITVISYSPDATHAATQPPFRIFYRP